MPYYEFIKETGETETIFLHMNEPKVYNGEDGTEIGLWKRVYHVPQMSLDTRIDPFDKNAFINTQNLKKETVGSTLDRSAEMSEKRAALRGGVDPIKQVALEKYAAKRHGKRHPSELQQSMEKTQSEANKALKKLGIQFNLKQPKSRRLTG